MAKLIHRLLSIIGSRDLTDVPLAALRHDDKKCHLEEGSGAKPVEFWSIYKFFADYADGREEAAVNDFTAWYLRQYERYSRVDKSLGGMRNGSLSRVIAKATAADSTGKNDAQPPSQSKIIREAVEAFVRERLQLLDSIRDSGFSISGRVKIIGVRRKGLVMIRNGHHRIAVLKALGYSHVPLISVYPNEIAYSLSKKGLLKKIRRRSSGIK